MPRKSTGRTQKQLLAENEELRRRLDEVEETLRAIHSGEVDALVVSGVDGERIFTLKQTEEALQEEKVREQQYLDIAGVMFLVLAVDRKVILINKKGCEILGYAEQEIVGRNWCDHFLPQDQKDRIGAIFDQLMTGESERGEYFENPVLTKSGQERLVAWHNSLLTDRAGKIIGIVSSGVDITERRQAEDALAASEAELRALFAGMTDVVIVYDTDGRYLKIAPTNPASLYRPPDEMQGMTLHDILPKEQADYIVSMIREAIQNSQVVNGEYSLQIDGNEIWFSASASRLSDTTAILVAHDITTRKRAEERILRQLEHLASLSEIDRTIASNFDLRVCLQMILKHVSEQLKVDVADVLVHNEHMQTLEFTAGRGFRSPAIERTRLRLGEGQAGQAVLTRQLVQIPDVAASGAVFAQPELLEAENVAAYFAVPLITKGQVKGVLEVYHRTPLNPDAEWLNFLNTLAGEAAIAIDNVQMFESLQRSTNELELAYDATIEGWSHALDLRDKETEGHTQRVTEMTLKLADAFGLSNAELAQVRWGALLHDIGKMGVPDAILLKPGPLTDEEWAVMKKHPTFAYEMLVPIRYLRLALDIPYCHHEKWDGTGYPRGLKGEQIPLPARIFAVVDVWDALISDRPYRKAWSEEKARQYIQVEAGTHFDPQVVNVFMQFPENHI